MNNDLLQAVLDIVFSKYMLYLAPMIFLFMVCLFADRLIEVVFDVLASKRRWS
jgi:hypothetical protein